MTKFIRNPTIDAVKGTLICLVFLGHLFTQQVVDNPYKWMIYGFHMPVFLGLGGLLLDLDKLRSLRFKELLSKYFDRMLLPWGIRLCLLYFGCAGPRWANP